MDGSSMPRPLWVRPTLAALAGASVAASSTQGTPPDAGFGFIDLSS